MPASDRPQTHAWCRATTRMGTLIGCSGHINNKKGKMSVTRNDVNMSHVFVTGKLLYRLWRTLSCNVSSLLQFHSCPNYKHRIRILINFASVKIIHEGRCAVVVMKQNSLRTESTFGFSILVENDFIVWRTSSKSPLRIHYRNQYRLKSNTSFPSNIGNVSCLNGQMVPGACAICRVVLKWEAGVNTQEPSSGYSSHYHHGFGLIVTIYLVPVLTSYELMQSYFVL
jgi:hypothetical protein